MNDSNTFMRMRRKGILSHIDPILLGCAVLISFAGLVTMNTFSGNDFLAVRQAALLGFSLIIFFTFSFIDWRFLRRTHVIFLLYILSILSLVLIFSIGHFAGGAARWFNIGPFSLQPSDPAKIILILLLAKYFSRRHVEIRHWRHILISGVYTLIPFLLIFLQPDFGSAVIIFACWLGIILVSGISKKHLLFVFGVGILSFAMLWMFAFAPYQKARIISFMNPLEDVRGTGYNAFQSVVAIGSGGLFGKGVGYGTQSRLEFLPEHQTDFIFASFAEEWGFVGSVLMLILFCILIFRIVKIAGRGETNFEILFGLGVAIIISSHVIINVGMNLGLLPVTGIPLPFASYGGSHLLAEFAALGILSGMNKYSRVTHKEDLTLSSGNLETHGF